MKRMKNMLVSALILALTTIIVLELLALAAPADDKGLMFVHGERDCIWYLRTDTLVSPAPGTFSFWNKIVPAKDGEFFSRMASFLRQAGKKPARLEYVQALEEIDCSTGKSKILSVVYYDRKDRIMLARTAPGGVPDLPGLKGDEISIGETLCNASPDSVNETEVQRSPFRVQSTGYQVRRSEYEVQEKSSEAAGL